MNNIGSSSQDSEYHSKDSDKKRIHESYFQPPHHRHGKHVDTIDDSDYVTSPPKSLSSSDDSLVSSPIVMGGDKKSARKEHLLAGAEIDESAYGSESLNHASGDGVESSSDKTNNPKDEAKLESDDIVFMPNTIARSFEHVDESRSETTTISEMQVQRFDLMLVKHSRSALEKMIVEQFDNHTRLSSDRRDSAVDDDNDIVHVDRLTKKNLSVGSQLNHFGLPSPEGNEDDDVVVDAPLMIRQHAEHESRSGVTAATLSDHPLAGDLIAGVDSSIKERESDSLHDHEEVVVYPDWNRISPSIFVASENDSPEGDREESNDLHVAPVHAIFRHGGASQSVELERSRQELKSRERVATPEEAPRPNSVRSSDTPKESLDHHGRSNSLNMVYQSENDDADEQYKVQDGSIANPLLALKAYQNMNLLAVPQPNVDRLEVPIEPGPLTGQEIAEHQNTEQYRQKTQSVRAGSEIDAKKLLAPPRRRHSETFVDAHFERVNSIPEVRRRRSFTPVFIHASRVGSDKHTATEENEETQEDSSPTEMVQQTKQVKKAEIKRQISIDEDRRQTWDRLWGRKASLNKDRSTATDQDSDQMHDKVHLVKRKKKKKMPKKEDSAGRGTSTKTKSPTDSSQSENMMMELKQKQELSSRRKVTRTERPSEPQNPSMEELEDLGVHVDDFNNNKVNHQPKPEILNGDGHPGTDQLPTRACGTKDPFAFLSLDEDDIRDIEEDYAKDDFDFDADLLPITEEDSSALASKSNSIIVHNQSKESDLHPSDERGKDLVSAQAPKVPDTVVSQPRSKPKLRDKVRQHLMPKKPESVVDTTQPSYGDQKPRGKLLPARPEVMRNRSETKHLSEVVMETFKGQSESKAQYHKRSKARSNKARGDFNSLVRKALAASKDEGGRALSKSTMDLSRPEALPETNQKSNKRSSSLSPNRQARRFSLSRSDETWNEARRKICVNLKENLSDLKLNKKGPYFFKDKTTAYYGLVHSALFGSEMVESHEANHILGVNGQTVQQLQKYETERLELEKRISNLSREDGLQTPLAEDPDQSLAALASAPKSAKARRKELKAQFREFAKFGDRHSDGTQITLARSDKWLKQAGIVNGKAVTTADTDILYRQMSKSHIWMSFSRWNSFIIKLATWKNLDLQKVQNALILCGKPQAERSILLGDRSLLLQRLTDVSLYGGTHKNRFTSSGRGKGLNGRRDLNDLLPIIWLHEPPTNEGLMPTVPKSVADYFLK